MYLLKLGGLNNTNNAGFSDIASDLSRSDIAQQASGSARRPWGRDSGNDGITISRILGGNAILSLGTKVQAGGNAFAGNSDKTLETKSETTNIESTGTTQEKSASVETNNKWNVGTDLHMEYKLANYAKFSIPILRYCYTYIQRSPLYRFGDNEDRPLSLLLFTPK